MIVVDIETSGIYPEQHGIWQIGALDYYNPQNTFLEESSIDEEDEITEDALKVIGKTKEDLRNKNKQSQKQLLENFFKWIETTKIKNIVCQNFFDYIFLTFKARKYGIKIPFKYRAFDLHSIAQAIYHKDNGKFLIKEENKELRSGMNFPKIMELCGMQDDRIQLKDGGVIKEGKPHNALEDAKLEAECLRRLLAK